MKLSERGAASPRVETRQNFVRMKMASGNAWINSGRRKCVGTEPYAENARCRRCDREVDRDIEPGVNRRNRRDKSSTLIQVKAMTGDLA
jgi:hypothetical protein